MSADESLVRTIVVVIAAVVLLPLVAMVVMMGLMGVWGGGHTWSWGTGAGPPWVWFLASLVPMLALLGIVYVLYRAFRRPGTRGRNSALEELRAAYARGELSDEEFERRRQRLRNDR